MRIRTKFFLTVTIVVALFLGCLTYYLLRTYTQFVFDKIRENSVYSVSQLSQNIGSLFQSYEQITDFIYLNAELQETMLRNYPDFADALTSYNDYMQPYLKSIIGSRQILRLNFYTDNPTFTFPDVKLIDEELRQSAWFKALVVRKLNNYWAYGGMDDYFHVNILRLTQRLNNFRPDADLYVSIDVDGRFLYDLIAKESQKTQFIAFLPDGTEIMNSMQHDELGRSLQQLPYYGDMMDAPSGSKIVKLDGKSYLLTYQTIDSRNSIKGMKVLSLSPLAELTAKVRETRQIVILLCVLFLSVFSAVIYAISYGLTKRLMGLADKMKKMNMDNLQTLSIVEGRDEASQLALAYNRMVTRMERLIREGYELAVQRKELELRTKESELYALQTQIHPHYLFNVLNAVRGNLLEKGDRENAQLVNLLARSFRNLLGKGGQLIALSEELDIVETYLSIQSARFAERLGYELQVPDSLGRMEVPKLFLQTIVENAVIHGVERSEHRTTVTIAARLAGERDVQMTVHDDGPGIPPDRLDAIRESLRHSPDMREERHIGLRNVQERLAKLYGEAYGLWIDSSDGAGTTVTMRLPLRKRGEEA
ncbi:sensor histidine kinase [Cohnella sp. 56]|uniref:sensor histidine kinase n=1 Tax=Cohnella sp. 56 TaxID=3113722 RepID=UPI0030E7B9BD